MIEVGITSLKFQDAQCGILDSYEEFVLCQSFQENPFSCEQFTSILLSHNLSLYNPNVKVHPLNCAARVCPDEITDIQVYWLRVVMDHVKQDWGCGTGSNLLWQQLFNTFKHEDNQRL